MLGSYISFNIEPKNQKNFSHQTFMEILILWFIALKLNLLSQPTPCLTLWQDGGRASEGSAGGFGGDWPGGSSGHSFSHMAGGVPHEPHLLWGDPNPHSTHISWCGGHRPARHGEFDSFPSQRLQTAECVLVQHYISCQSIHTYWTCVHYYVRSSKYAISDTLTWKLRNIQSMNAKSSVSPWSCLKTNKHANS